MAAHDPLHGGQANSRPRKFALIVQSLKSCEELVRIFHVKSGPVVGDEVYFLALEYLLSKLDAGTGLFGRELPGIPEQVFEGQPQQSAVSFSLQAGSDNERSLPLRLRLLQIRGYLLGQRAQIDGLQGEP